MTFARWLIAGLVLGAAVLAGPAAARAERAGGSGEVVVLPPVLIEATPPAPQAIYVIRRSRIDFERLEGQDTFLREVTESVRRAPF